MYIIYRAEEKFFSPDLSKICNSTTRLRLRPKRLHTGCTLQQGSGTHLKIPTNEISRINTNKADKSAACTKYQEGLCKLAKEYDTIYVTGRNQS